MKSQFKISRISEGKVFAKEVNPYGEKAPRYIPIVGGGMELLVQRYFTEKYFQWRKAENNLQEYELTEKSCKEITWEFNEQALNDSHPDTTIIGQLISGEIIEENGVKKIRI